MIAGKKLVDLFCRGLYMVDGDVMVHGVNDTCQELAHISLFVIGACQKLRTSVMKVCGNNLGNITFLIILIKLVQTVGKKTKGSADKNTTGFPILQLFCNIKHALTG